MRKYKKEEMWVDELDAIECDRCHKVIKNDSIEGQFELQECVHIEVTCGYGSKTWGDLHRAEVDFCEQCIYDLIAEYVRVTRYA